MSKTIGVMLAGCGVYDGAEVHESVLTLLALGQAGAQAICMAPDIEQAHVVNHLTGEVAAGESRNVLVEAARIARGEIRDLKTVTPQELDGLIIPGGFGAAKNLCNYAFKGAEMEVEPSVAAFIKAFQQTGKPIGLLCIAPVIAAKLFGDQQVHLTIGNDAATAGHITAWGACHSNAVVEDMIADPDLNIYTAPAYMLGTNLPEVFAGIKKVVDAVVA